MARRKVVLTVEFMVKEDVTAQMVVDDLNVNYKNNADWLDVAGYVVHEDTEQQDLESELSVTIVSDEVI